MIIKLIIYNLASHPDKKNNHFAKVKWFFSNLTAHYYPIAMPETNRISSIDIMRGLTLVLMLFVNDLYMPGVPAWLGHMRANFDGMGLADWVFPGFLFMVGMAIPYSIGKRIAEGQNTIYNCKTYCNKIGKPSYNWSSDA